MTEVAVTRKVSLYESTKDLLDIVQLVEERDEIGVDSTELIPAFQFAVSNLKESVDRRISVLEKLPFVIKMLEEEANALMHKAKVLGNVLDRVKEHTKLVMSGHPDLEFKGSFRRLALENNGGKQSIEYYLEFENLKNLVPEKDLNSFPAEYIKDQKVYVFDKAAFEKDLREGKIQSEIAKVIPRGQHVRVR